jgi:hypothetical protein
MRKFLILVQLALLGSTLSCSPRDFLTRRLAGTLIAGSDTFKAQQQFWLRTGTIANRDYISPEYLVLQRRGWITATSTACPAEIGPPPCWDVILSPLGVDAFRDLLPSTAAATRYFSVPVARRELVAITGIRKEGSTADVDFLWKWVPLNEVGSALYAGDVQYASTVGFSHYDDGWRLLEGAAPKSLQGLDDALKSAEPAH